MNWPPPSSSHLWRWQSDKIINYYHSESRGDWRNTVCFIADDGDESDGNIHMDQADELSNIIDAFKLLKNK